MLKKLRYPLELLLAVLMFSTFEVASKSMHGHITAPQLTFYRFLIGGLVLLPFGLKDLRRHHKKFSLKLFGLFLVMGFLLVTVSMNVCQIGLQFSSASIVAVLFSSNPLFISLFSAVILHEKLTLPKVVGLVVGIVGVCVTVGNIIRDPSSVNREFIFGIVLVLLAMLVFSVYTVFNKKLSVQMGSCGCIALSSILGAVTLLPVVISSKARTGINPFFFDGSSVWLQFLYISIFTTGIAYFFYYDGLSHLDTSTSSMSFFIKPPLASVLAAIFLNEPITVNLVAGIVLILAGVTLSVKFGAKNQAAATPEDASA
jgi:drug/metabolite transporter (DMT)-like permease